MKYIFDLDGTLYPWPDGVVEQISEAYFQSYSRELEIPYEEAKELALRLWKEYGDSMRGLIEEGRYPIDKVHEVADIFHTFMNYDRIVSHCPTMQSLFTELPGEKVIQSNSTRGHVGKVMDILGIAPHVAAHFGNNDVNFRSKPDPSYFQHVLDEMKWQPEDVILVEDKLKNIKTAKEMGFQTAYIGWGEDSYHDDYAPYIDHSFNTIYEFLEHEIAKKVLKESELER